ncbi:hypothetical protein [Spirillospora sp. NPDC029432]|uniref:hypothetical protein n=1 Tax=Spirillospora sp. NPDC029432 TaxID=3154599 RepID=UPI003456F10A
MIRNSRRVVALAIAGAVAIAPVISGCGAGANPQTAAPTQLTEGVNASVPKGAATSQVDIRNMFLLGPQPDKMLPAGASVPLYATVINQVKGRGDRLVGVSSADFAQVKITGGAVTLPAAQPSGEGTAVTLTGQAAAATPSPTAGATKTKKPDATESGQPGATESGRPEATESGQPGAAETDRPATGETSPPASESPTATPPPGAATTRPTAATDTDPKGNAPTVVLTGLKRQLLGGETLRLRLQFEKAGSIELSVPVVPQQNEYAEYVAVSQGVPAPGATVTPSTPAPAGGEGGHGSTPEGGHGGSQTPSPATSASETPAEGGGH